MPLMIQRCCTPQLFQHPSTKNFLGPPLMPRRCTQIFLIVEGVTVFYIGTGLSFFWLSCVKKKTKYFSKLSSPSLINIFLTLLTWVHSIIWLLSFHFHCFQIALIEDTTDSEDGGGGLMFKSSVLLDDWKTAFGVKITCRVSKICMSLTLYIYWTLLVRMGLFCKIYPLLQVILWSLNHIINRVYTKILKRV